MIIYCNLRLFHHFQLEVIYLFVEFQLHDSVVMTPDDNDKVSIILRKKIF